MGNRRVRNALLSLVVVTAAGCDAENLGRRLDNAAGKADSAGVIVELEGDKAEKFYFVCEDSPGCDIEIEFRLVAPELCAFFPDEPECGTGSGPWLAPVAGLAIRPPVGDEQAYDLDVESADGIEYDLVVAGTTAPRLSIPGGAPGTYMLSLIKAVGAPAVTLGVAAEWQASGGTADGGVIDGGTLPDAGTVDGGQAPDAGTVPDAGAVTCTANADCTAAGECCLLWPWLPESSCGPGQIIAGVDLCLPQWSGTPN